MKEKRRNAHINTGRKGSHAPEGSGRDRQAARTSAADSSGKNTARHSSRAALTVPVTITERDFCSFALFDAMHHKKVWRSPVIFAAIMSAFAAVCFLMAGHVSHAALLGTVLLIVGLGLPLVYFCSFFSMTNRQAKIICRSKNPTVYTLALSQEGLRVENKKDTLFHPWTEISDVYTRKNYTYIYTVPVEVTRTNGAAADNAQSSAPQSSADSPEQTAKAQRSADSPELNGKTQHSAEGPKQANKTQRSADSPEQTGKAQHSANSPKQTGKAQHSANSPKQIGKAQHSVDGTAPAAQQLAYMLPHRLTDRDALLALLGESLPAEVLKK